MSQQETSAIVIGGSVAGLLAARVLSDYYNQVTIIERDALPETPEVRNGTPQARHLHALLAHGQHLLQEMFPNIEQDFEAQGASKLIWGINTASRVSGGWIQPYDVGIRSHVLSRVTLEWVIRQRVSALSNVTFMTQQQVNHLLTDDSQTSVVGVNITSRTDKQTQNLYANLVVDTSGRQSKSMQWLEEIGYDAPQETVINAHLGYATRWYQLDENTTYSWKTLMVYAIPKKNLNRGGGMFITEGNKLVVTLAGANRDYAPTDENEFLAFAQSLASPVIYEVIKNLQPISPIHGYRRMENRFRHYEKLSRMPKGFIVMGDAACGFNPIYGQGMTAAAIEAKQLDLLLQQTDIHNLGNFSLKFQKRLAKAINGAWLMATGEDLRYSETEGATPSFMDRITHHYMDAMIEVMPDDPILCTAFIETMNLTSHPIKLFHPKLVLRVLGHKLFGKRTMTYDQPATKLTASPLS